MTGIHSLRLQPPVRQLLSKLTALLSAHGVEAYATGGFLRDALLGFEFDDLDISVRADPLELGPELADAFGGNSFPLDAGRGHVRVLVPEYDLHLDLRPLTGTLEDDLLARDYTVDAMAAPLAEIAAGSTGLTDPTGGLADLRSRTIRLVSEDGLVKDPLRLLRAVRLAVQLDFEIEPGTGEAIRRHAGLLAPSVAEGASPQTLGAGVPSHKQAPPAVERQRDELVLMLRTNHAARALRLLDGLDLLDRLLPEAAVMRDVEQPKEHTWNVFGHSLAAVGALDMMLAETEPASESSASLWRELWSQLEWWDGARDYFREQIVPNAPRRAVLKFAGFLHDVGKPQTKSFQEGGRMRFFGHANAGAEIAAVAMRRLRFSARETKLVRAMIEAHLRPLQMAQQGAPTRKAIYKFFRDTAGAGIDTLFLSLADHLGTVGPRVNPDGWRQHVALVSYVIQKRFDDGGEVVEPSKLISGEEIMAALDVPPGPLLGELLEEIREGQASGEVTTVEEAIALARRRMESAAKAAS